MAPQSASVHLSDDTNTELAPLQSNTVAETQHSSPIYPLPTPNPHPAASSLNALGSLPASYPPGFHPPASNSSALDSSAFEHSALHPPVFNFPASERFAFGPSVFDFFAFNPSAFDPLVFNPSAFDPSVFRPATCGTSNFDFGPQAEHKSQPFGPGYFWKPQEESLGGAPHDFSQFNAYLVSYALLTYSV